MEKRYNISTMYYGLNDEPIYGKLAPIIFDKIRKEAIKNGKIVVAEDELLDGRIVVTVWQGMDTGNGDETPRIYRTEIKDGRKTTILEYYSNISEAEIGHKVVVRSFKPEHVAMRSIKLKIKEILE